jgi:hypothetical protein
VLIGFEVAIERGRLSAPNPTAGKLFFPGGTPASGTIWTVILVVSACAAGVTKYLAIATEAEALRLHAGPELFIRPRIGNRRLTRLDMRYIAAVDCRHLLRKIRIVGLGPAGARPYDYHQHYACSTNRHLDTVIHTSTCAVSLVQHLQSMLAFDLRRLFDAVVARRKSASFHPLAIAAGKLGRPPQRRAHACQLGKYSLNEIKDVHVSLLANQN